MRPTRSPFSYRIAFVSIREIRGQKKYFEAFPLRPHKTISSCPRCRHKTTPHCISANSCNSWTKDFVEDECLEGTTERSDGNRGRSPREEAIALILPGRQYATGHVNNPLIALVPIRATDPVAIQSIEMIRANPCNSWAKKQQVGKKNLQPIQPTDLFCASAILFKLSSNPTT